MHLNAQSLDAAKFASTHEKKGILTGLMIAKDRVAATDSFHMIEVKHPQFTDETPSGIRNDSETGVFPAKSAIHARKNIPKGENLFALKKAFTYVDEKKNMTITTTDFMEEKTVESRLIDGVYPNYDQVFPKGEPIARIMVDAKFLQNMAAYFEAHGDSRSVLIQFYGETQPLVFKGHTAVTIQDVRGLIMPKRMADVEKETSVRFEDVADKLQEGVQSLFPDGKTKVTVTVNDKKKFQTPKKKKK